MPDMLQRNFPGRTNLSLLRQRLRFHDSARYWESRYAQGHTSGLGSYGEVAQAKADFVNAWVKDHRVHSVTELGCGDGNQLSLAEYPSYMGLDVSRTAILLCKERFRDDQTKSFYLYNEACFVDNAGVFKSDLSISLDVIYHLVEDRVFDRYMRHLFNAGKHYTIIYSTDTRRARSAPHVRHRNFSSWISGNCPGWRLLRQCNGPRTEASQADFFIYKKLDT